MQNPAAGAVADPPPLAVHTDYQDQHDEQAEWRSESMFRWTRTLAEWDPRAGPDVVLHNLGGRHAHLEGMYATYLEMVIVDQHTVRVRTYNLEELKTLNLHTLNTLPPDQKALHALRVLGELMTMEARRNDPFLNLRMLSIDPFPVGTRVHLVNLSVTQHGALVHYNNRVGLVRASRPIPSTLMYEVELFDVGEEQGLPLVNVHERHVRPAPLCESRSSATSDAVSVNSDDA